MKNRIFLAVLAAAVLLTGCAENEKVPDSSSVENSSSSSSSGESSSSSSVESSSSSSSVESSSSSSSVESSSSSSSVESSSSSSSVESSSSSSSAESSSSDESDQNITQNISAVSSNDPQVGFFVALHANKNAVKAGSPFSAEISFGSCARDHERITVTISSEDFEVTKSCPDEYVVDGQKYSEADFHVVPLINMSPDDLPAHFTISLSPKSKKEIYSGSTEIVLEEYLVAGHTTGTITLYHYGNSNLICFSTVSQEEAESIFNNTI